MVLGEVFLHLREVVLEGIQAALQMQDTHLEVRLLPEEAAKLIIGGLYLLLALGNLVRQPRDILPRLADEGFHAGYLITQQGILLMKGRHLLRVGRAGPAGSQQQGGRKKKEWERKFHARIIGSGGVGVKRGVCHTCTVMRGVRMQRRYCPGSTWVRGQTMQSSSTQPAGTTASCPTTQSSPSSAAAEMRALG